VSIECKKKENWRRAALDIALTVKWPVPPYVTRLQHATKQFQDEFRSVHLIPKVVLLM